MNRFRGEASALEPESLTLDERTLPVSMLPLPRRRKTRRILSAAGVVAALAVLFQLFFRYAYLTDSGAVYRIDRVTHQICRVTDNGLDCTRAALSRSPSTSVSTSTSTSTSL